MTTEKKPSRKPLSFSTTMRNPDRIANFLNCLIPYENMKLSHDIVMKVAAKLIKSKLYTPYYINRNQDLKEIYNDENKEFTVKQVDEIIKNSPQDHKEAGFKKGWESRFDTWYKLSKEFGFVYYEMDKPIKVSETGHMLVDALNENPINERKIQNVLLNSMMKYQTDNPCRKNLNSNVPLLLLLQVIKLLKEDNEEKNNGIFRKELSLFICWSNNDAESLYKKIKEIRKTKGYNYSDEYIYDICLELLEATEKQKNQFKMNKIVDEAVDEYIRKMRSTGILSLRGSGRFIDFNTLEIDKINYVLKNYSTYKKFSSGEEYYKYMGQIDENILTLPNNNVIDMTKIRKDALEKYSKKYDIKTIIKELKIASNKKESKDLLLRTIPAPARLEFLTSIALKQHFKTLDVRPNYIVDDEGVPTCTALGNNADIVCYDNDYDSLVEVTLMTSRKQLSDEIIPIKRHLLEAKAKNPNTFSVFVAPRIHPDAKDMADWYKNRDNVDIITLNFDQFISEIISNNKISELLKIVQ